MEISKEDNTQINKEHKTENDEVNDAPLETEQQFDTDVLKDNTLNLINSLKDTIKCDFVKTLIGMVNEFDLVFDYVNKATIKKLKSYIKKLENDAVFYNKETLKFIKDMENFSDNLYKINVGDTKLKSQQFDFLNELVLFDGILEFKIFKDENKNTKKTLVNYLYTMYMSSNLVNLDFNNIDSVDALTSQLRTFVDEMKEKTEKDELMAQKKDEKNKPKVKQNVGNVNDVFSNLLGNKDIMNIATDMAKDLQNQNINPMSLMSSLLTGKVDKRLDSIINKITNTLEEKVSTGEINKDALEQQANDILNMVGNSNITSQLPMLKTLLNNNKFK